MTHSVDTVLATFSETIRPINNSEWDHLQELSNIVDLANAVKIPEPSSKPSGPSTPPLNELARAMAMKYQIDPIDVQSIFEAILQTDNTMVLEALRKVFVLAKITLDTHETQIAKQTKIHQQAFDDAVDRYNTSLEKIEQAKITKQQSIKQSIARHKASWGKILDQLAIDLESQSKRSKSNIDQFSLMDSLEERDHTLISKTKTGYKIDICRAKRFGYGTIQTIMKRAERKVTEQIQMNHWQELASIPTKQLELAFYECKDFTLSTKLLLSILERHGVDAVIDAATMDVVFDEVDKHGYPIDYDIPQSAEQAIYYWETNWALEKSRWTRRW